MYKYKLSDFQVALEEAILAESGFLDTDGGTAQLAFPEAHPRRFQEASGSSQDQVSYARDKASFFRVYFLTFLPTYGLLLKKLCSSEKFCSV